MTKKEDSKNIVVEQKKIMEKFENEHESEIDSLARAIAVRKDAEAGEKEAREAILAALKEHDLHSFQGKSIQIRIVPARDGYSTVDISKIKEKNKALYNVLVKKYPKQIKGHEESIWVKLRAAQP